MRAHFCCQINKSHGSTCLSMCTIKCNSGGGSQRHTLLVLCQSLDSRKCRSMLDNCAFKENVGGCSQRKTPRTFGALSQSSLAPMNTLRTLI